MSVIAEALKKAQDTARRKASPSKKTDIKEPKPIKPPTGKRSRPFYIYAIPLLVLVLLFSVVFVFYFLRQNRVEIPEVIEVEVIEEVKEKEPVLEAQLENPAPQDFSPAAMLAPSLTLDEVKESIHLNGIMYTPEKPLAVINNSIWAEGEIIGRFKISEIGEDFVKVVSNGEEFVIKLKR